MNELTQKFKLYTILVSIAFLMTIGLIFLTVSNPDGLGQLHDFTDPQIVVTTLQTTPSEGDASLYSLVFDTFFMMGYLTIFVGIYQLTKHLDQFIPKIGLTLGISTFIFDLLENAFLLVIFKAVPLGFDPDNLIFGLLWLFTSVKDISSVLATFILAVLLLYGSNSQENLRLKKLILAFFLLLYAVLGALGLIFPLFLQLRNLSFVLDMAAAVVIFYFISRS